MYVCVFIFFCWWFFFLLQCGLLLPAAKNLILAGVKSVMLHDEGKVELWDLSSNFVFSEDDVGKNRALVAVQNLQELNNAVVVHTLTTKLAKEQLADFQVHFSVVIYWLFSVMQVIKFILLRHVWGSI